MSGAATIRRMVRYEIADAAVRAGVSVEELRRLVEAGILRPDDENRLTAGDVRRVGMVSSLTAAGIPLDGLGAAIRSGQVSLDFLDEPAYERFSALSGVTFAELAERTGVPVQMLMLIREAAGSAPPLPDDQVRDEELPYAEFLEFQVKVGFDPAASQGLLRVGGDSLRRMAETETDWWRSEVILPAVAAGKRPDEILGADFANRMSMLAERAILGMYHLQEAKAWSGTIIEGLEMLLAAAGLHSRLEHPPAMCFLDITGYTRLTQERGDTAAAGPGGPARAAGAARFDQARRPAREVVGRRRDVPLPRSRAGRGGGARDGRWAWPRQACRRPTSACMRGR